MAAVNHLLYATRRGGSYHIGIFLTSKKPLFLFGSTDRRTQQKQEN